MCVLGCRDARRACSLPPAIQRPSVSLDGGGARATIHLPRVAHPCLRTVFIELLAGFLLDLLLRLTMLSSSCVLQASAAIIRDKLNELLTCRRKGGASPSGEIVRTYKAMTSVRLWRPCTVQQNRAKQRRSSVSEALGLPLTLILPCRGYVSICKPTRTPISRQPHLTAPPSHPLRHNDLSKPPSTVFEPIRVCSWHLTRPHSVE